MSKSLAPAALEASAVTFFSEPSPEAQSQPAESLFFNVMPALR
jgi:hypothetical protein